MRSLVKTAAIGLGIALVLLGAPTAAMASDTYHGSFTSGVGWNEDSALDGFPLSATGSWTVNEGVNGIQVGGNFRVMGKGQACVGAPMPCPFMLNLSAFGPWTAEGSSYVGYLDLGTDMPKFDLTLQGVDGEGGMTLTIDITGCPYGWQQWVLTGVER